MDKINETMIRAERAPALIGVLTERYRAPLASASASPDTWTEAVFAIGANEPIEDLISIWYWLEVNDIETARIARADSGAALDWTLAEVYADRAIWALAHLLTRGVS